MNKLQIILYRVGLLSSILVSSYHFYLPTHFNWLSGLENTPATLSWSLLFLNFDWSLLILLVSIVLLWFSLKPQFEPRSKRQLSLVFACYWLFHAIYLMFLPMPVPQNFSWVGLITVGFALVTGGLIALGQLIFNPQISCTSQAISNRQGGLSIDNNETYSEESA